MTGRTVLCFGDSNTHGTVAMKSLSDIGRLGPDTRWPGVLAAALEPGTRVVEEGHPGRTTVHDDPIEGEHKNGRRALLVALETHRPIDLVILMLGTNDLKARFSVTAFDIARSVGVLADTILGSDAAGGKAPGLLVVSPVPIEETGCLRDIFEGGAVKSRKLASLIADHVNAPCLDAGQVAACDPTDGVHLSAGAHGALGKAIAARVKELLGG